MTFSVVVRGVAVSNALFNLDVSSRFAVLDSELITAASRAALDVESFASFARSSL